MNKSFGQILQEIVATYKGSNINLSLKDFACMDNNVELLASCCKENNIDFSVEEIRQFLQDLFKSDSHGDSVRDDVVRIRYDDSKAPYRYKVTDYNKIPRPIEEHMQDLNTIVPYEQDLRVQPECTNDHCEKQAYFGLPFCPWCMRQIPPFIPKRTKKHAFGGEAKVYPVMNVEDIEIHRVTKPAKVQGASKRIVDLDEVIVDDGDLYVTRADVENIKDLHKYIPRH